MSDTHPKQRYDIFLSYSRQDIDRARWFIDLFEGKGLSVFWDLTSIPPGTTFHQFIRQSLNRSCCVVVLWTDASVKSKWVDIEAREGEKRSVLFPVLLDELKEDELPFGLHMINATDLHDWDGRSSHRNLDLLLQTLHARLGKEEAAKRKAEEAPASEMGDPTHPTVPPASSRSSLAKNVALGGIVVVAIFFVWITLNVHEPVQEAYPPATDEHPETAELGALSAEQVDKMWIEMADKTIVLVMQNLRRIKVQEPDTRGGEALLNMVKFAGEGLSKSKDVSVSIELLVAKDYFELGMQDILDLYEVLKGYKDSNKEDMGLNIRRYTASFYDRMNAFYSIINKPR